MSGNNGRGNGRNWSQGQGQNQRAQRAERAAPMKIPKDQQTYNVNVGGGKSDYVKNHGTDLVIDSSMRSLLCFLEEHLFSLQKQKSDNLGDNMQNVSRMLKDVTAFQKFLEQWIAFVFKEILPEDCDDYKSQSVHALGCKVNENRHTGGTYEYCWFYSGRPNVPDHIIETNTMTLDNARCMHLVHQIHSRLDKVVRKFYDPGFDTSKQDKEVIEFVESWVKAFREMLTISQEMDPHIEKFLKDSSSNSSNSSNRSAPRNRGQPVQKTKPQKPLHIGGRFEALSKLDEHAENEEEVCAEEADEAEVEAEVEAEAVEADTGKAECEEKSAPKSDQKSDPKSDPKLDPKFVKPTSRTKFSPKDKIPLNHLVSGRGTLKGNNGEEIPMVRESKPKTPAQRAPKTSGKNQDPPKEEQFPGMPAPQPALVPLPRPLPEKEKKLNDREAELKAKEEEFKAKEEEFKRRIMELEAKEKLLKTEKSEQTVETTAEPAGTTDSTDSWENAPLPGQVMAQIESTVEPAVEPPVESEVSSDKKESPKRNAKGKRQFPKNRSKKDNDMTVVEVSDNSAAAEL
ncbi:MAG: hypothetical protein Satyrvirus1_24 [Satyrvirus sp.]|uniref:Uncharacterized protein n=1 Tax=Satyrvirus sp. TaxID=2487771 RepID=A0A3G5ACH2_9VIRU|nr:MAG: hypothetical protein Satyrvirus1_24 [Satyrvirus sp.]